MNRILTLFILFVVFLIPVIVTAQAHPRLLPYFKSQGGGAVIKRYSDIRKYGITKIGHPDGSFISTESAIARIVQEGQARGGGSAFDVAYMAKALGTEWDKCDTLIRFHIPDSNLARLNLRLPDRQSAGANKLFIPGARTVGGINEGFIDQLSYSLTGPVPNYFGSDTGNFEILVPAAAPCNCGPQPGAFQTPSAVSCCGPERWMYCFPAAMFLLLLIIALFCRRWLKGALTEQGANLIRKPNPSYSSENLDALIEKCRPNADPVILRAAQALIDRTKSAADIAANAYAVAAADDSEKAALKLDADEKLAAYRKANEQLFALSSTTIPAAALANLSSLLPPTIEVSALEDDKLTKAPSASRLIALISAMLLTVIVLTMASFFVYQYSCTGNAPDFSNLTAVFVALGIGMAPYAINRVTSAASSKDKSL